MRSFIQGIKNLIYWLPVIWKDRDYDYYFVYALLHKKFAKMEEFFSNDAMTDTAPRHGLEIGVAKTLCERIIKDEYLDTKLEELGYNAKYGEDDKLFSFQQTDEGYLLKPTQDTEQREFFRKCCREADEQIVKDKKYLWHHIATHIDGWCD